jgi:hypothetical protein
VRGRWVRGGDVEGVRGRGGRGVQKLEVQDIGQGVCVCVCVCVYACMRVCV